MSKKRRAKDVKAIGDFIVAFSHLEYVMRYAFERMLGIASDQAEIILATYDFASLGRAIGALTETLPEQEPAASKRMNKLVSECLRINTERVRIVHGTWFAKGGTIHTSRNSFKSAEYFSDYQDLEKLIEDIDKAFEAFSLLIIDKDESWGPIAKYLHPERKTLRADSQVT